MQVPNAEKINPFDAEDQRIAEKLEITLPDLWMTERYEARLALAGVTLQIDPDAVIRAYDRLNIQIPCSFGVVFDSLDHDAGAETDQHYKIPDTYKRTLEETPFFTLLADPTPTIEEGSAELTDFGFLLGSRVMADLIETDRSAEMTEEKQKRASRINAGGIVAHFTTAVGNFGATTTHLYNALPYIGSGAGVIVLSSGVAARIATHIKSRNLKEQELCEFVEDELDEHVRSVAQNAQIISFVQNLGGPEKTRRLIKDIHEELDRIDPSVGWEGLD